MGYRSEVAYTIRFNDTTLGRQCFNIFLADAKQNEGVNGVFEDAKGEDPPLVIDLAKMQINFYADQVKWYEDYPDVKCHMNLIELAREFIEQCNEDVEEGNLEALGFIFCRIGEETTDIEEEYGGNISWDAIQPSRSLIIDWK